MCTALIMKEILWYNKYEELIMGYYRDIEEEFALSPISEDVMQLILEMYLVLTPMQDAH